MLRLLVLGDEPIAHGLLSARLSVEFEVSGEPCGHAESLAMARGADIDVVLIDADLRDADPEEFVASIALVCAAPAVALSAAASLGSAAAAALFLAGAKAVVHKPAGRLPLDLNGRFGEAVAAATRRTAAQVANAGLVTPLLATPILATPHLATPLLATPLLATPLLTTTP
jgi:CheY-like chemotaxis protein